MIVLENSNNGKTPVPHGGRKVNDWETLRPYVEKGAPPFKNNISDEKGEGKAIIDPNWGFGYQAELSGNNSTFSPDEE